jgi:osmotically-inducible protein OsmY
MQQMSKVTTFAAGAGVGAAVAYVLDAGSGARRRSMVQDKASRLTREGGGTVQGAAQAVSGKAHVVAARAQHVATGGDSAPEDDQTLKSKVESEIFRPADAPKGSVDVSVANGVVELRGQVDDPAQSEDLEKRARAVTGVRDVRNLLHLPGETAPNIVGTPGVSQ